FLRVDWTPTNPAPPAAGRATNKSARSFSPLLGWPAAGSYAAGSAPAALRGGRGPPGPRCCAGSRSSEGSTRCPVTVTYSRAYRRRELLGRGLGLRSPVQGDRLGERRLRVRLHANRL